MPDFTMILKAAADDRVSLRKCDVFRVLKDAYTVGCCTAMAAWLSEARPDLDAEIADCLAYLTNEMRNGS